VARVGRDFIRNGILVHAYLMYGFPSQTIQETVDSLEYVRQLFNEGCLQSGHWHRLIATEHSAIGRNPDEFGIQLRRGRGPPDDRVFGSWHIPFRDRTRANHDLLGPGLNDALVQYQRGRGLERPVHEWFPLPVPGTTIPPDAIARMLEE
jgi:hypothetical protein